MKARITFEFDGTCSTCPLEYDRMDCCAVKEPLDIGNDINMFKERHPDCPLEILEDVDE